MSSSTLKWIAIITMIIDHIGAVFFPQTMVLRAIGRLAFPIFAFAIAEGCIHTKDMKKYALRLGVFALLSEIPFDLAFSQTLLSLHHQNVFFTLCLGVVGIYFFERINEKIPYLGVFAIIFVGLLAEYLQMDYGIFGVLMIFGVYRAKTLKAKAFWIITINLCLGLLLSVSGGSLLQTLAALSSIPLLLYNGEKGNGPKYLFYSIYPIHLLLIAIINYV
jgi:hypothetical protein